MKTLLLCTVFLVGCTAIPQADGTFKHKLDAEKLSGAATAAAPFLPPPLNAIGLAAVGIGYSHDE